MKAVQFFIIISLGLLFGACGKDDRVCTQDDFIGTYIGATRCSNGGLSDTSIKITKGASDTELSIDLGGSFISVEIDGCNFTGSLQDANADLEYSGNLNGDEVEVTFKGILFMLAVDCTATAKKQ